MSRLVFVAVGTIFLVACGGPLNGAPGSGVSAVASSALLDVAAGAPTAARPGEAEWRWNVFGPR